MASSDAQASRIQPSRLKALFATLFLLCWIVVGVVAMTICRLFKLDATYKFPLLFHGVVCRLFGMQCEYSGERRTERPTLFVANHASYMDVFVLGAVIPGAFVAKSEVSGWPLFGKLAKLQNTLFFERKAQRAASQISQLHDHLMNESDLILFPEGTSTSGSWVAPFRSSLFAATEGFYVQPVSVAYVDYEGQPMSERDRDFYAWYLPDPKQVPPQPNRPFAAHFWEGLGLGRSRVCVHFHEPVLVEKGGRKAAAKVCEEKVRDGLYSLLGKSA